MVASIFATQQPGFINPFTPESVFGPGDEGFLLDFADQSSLFQTNLGNTNVSANDDTIGLAPSKRLMGGLAASDYIDAQTELRGNGNYVVFTDGVATAATYNPATGEGTAHRVDATNQSMIRFTDLVEGSIYRFDIQNTGAVGLQLRRSLGAGTVVGSIPPGERRVLYTDPFTGGVITITVENNGDNGTYILHSEKLVSEEWFIQPTTNYCPVWKTGNRCQFDGSDDYLAGTATCGSSGNTLVVKVTVPSTIGSAQIIAGLFGGSNDRFYIRQNVSGTITIGVGAETETGSTDTRDKTGVLALVEDGANAVLYWHEQGGSLVTEISETQNGAPSTSVPCFLGALNNNGSPSNFFSGSIDDEPLLIDRALSEAEIQQLTTYLNSL